MEDRTMRCKSEGAAREQARRNAINSNAPWVVFRDTNGVYNAERAYAGLDPDIIVAVYNARGKVVEEHPKP
jgi:hypothetical protein